MISDMHKPWARAQRANISRYRKILRTYLAINQRQFIERRLDEEERAPEDITHGTALANCANGVSAELAHAG